MTASSPIQVAQDKDRALAALRRGLLLVFPTETVYGVGANAASADAVARLAAATGNRTDRPSAWHAPTPAVARETLGLTAPLHLRALERLTPGPVTLIVEKDPDALVTIRQRLGVGAGALDNGKTINVRIPDHPVAAAILTEALNEAMPVAAQGVSAAGWGDGRTLPQSLATSDTIGAILDEGPTRLARPSTAVRLLAPGGFRVEFEGAIPKATVHKRIARTILFLCTGNTCRSPMAAAIARTILKDDPIPTTVLSAGVAASGGSPATPETIDALKQMGLDVSELSRHRSHALTARMIEDADAVFAMTQAHAREARAIAPGSAGKIAVLDPTGGDVPDPIGGSLEVYTRTARRLEELIRARLGETGGGPEGTG